MEENGMTKLLWAALEEGLSQLWGRPVRLRELAREPFVNASSWPAERLRARLDRGGWLYVFFKDLGAQRLTAPCASTPRELKSAYRELRMYQEILPRWQFGTPAMYAFRWDPPQGPFWLFLEDVGGTRLNYTGDFNQWVAAARWAARFHAATRHLPARQTDFLVRLDQTQARLVAECVLHKLDDLPAGERSLVRRALEQYWSRLDRFCALPQGVVHGEFFPKNIVVCSDRAEQPLAVIDWESAALGPSYLDLVSLTTGRWQEDQRLIMCRAYFEQYQASTGLALDWEGFCQDLQDVTLYHTVQWLGSRPDWKFRHGIGGWMRELEQTLPGLAMPV
jgi:hypothetical protein